MRNPSWMDQLKIPGKGIRLLVESEREQLFLSLSELHRGNLELASGDYYKWTGYTVRKVWMRDAPEGDQALVGVMKALVYITNQFVIESMDRRIDEALKSGELQIEEETVQAGEVKGWKYIN